nr:S1-like domain-containing RNA-binding protein [Aequitasia blattaphilus]
MGKKVSLEVVKKVDFGYYLGEEEDKVLLPKSEAPKDVEELEEGDKVEVFLYKDSADRIIATTITPLISLGEIALLEVVDVGKIGAFVDWGLKKDLLIPFKEQTTSLKVGDKCLVSLYVDKSKRLCGTMKLYRLLKTNSPYKKDDEVGGMVYEISDNFGAFVAVDNVYSALIPQKEVPKGVEVLDIVEGRVSGILEDGKINLSLRKKAWMQMEEDEEMILLWMQDNEGKIPFTDKASPETIQEEFGLSKNAFKRAIGGLLKKNKIKINENYIELL